jgi:hypothetical protein
MYGFDVSGLIQQSVKQGAYPGSPFRIITDAECGWLYGVNLNIRYGTNSMPAPNLTDSLVIINEGQRLYCMVNLVSGIAGLEHPVGCTITDSSGTVVFTHSQWVTVTYVENDTWVDFFEDVSLAVGAYTVTWSVCGKSNSHNLTVHSLQNYVTNDIDVNVVVTSTAGIDAYAVWNIIDVDVAAELLVYNATVELKGAETKDDNLIVFHLEVTAPPEGAGGIGAVGIATIVIVALIAVITVSMFAIPAISQVLVAFFAYNISMQRYTYKDCANLHYNEWVACMQGNYPDVWENIKDTVVEPTPPTEPDWMTYLMYGVFAIFSLVGLYVSVKYILPAIKGK